MVDSEADVDTGATGLPSTVPAGWSARFGAAPDATTADPAADSAADPAAPAGDRRAAQARARFLAAAAYRLGLSLHPGRTARAVVELAVSELAGTAVVVWPAAGRGGVVEWMAQERGDAACTGVGRTGVGRTGAGRSGRAAAASLPGPVLDALRGLETDPRPLLLEDLVAVPWFGPEVTGGPAVPAAAVVSLPGHGTPAGALVLLRHEADAPAASDDDIALVEEFALRAGTALAAATLFAQQVRLNEVLRASLAPPPLPAVPGVSLGAVYRPADEGLLIGGDFYDVLPRPGGPTTFLLGDVCGKGVEAAVSTGQVRQSVLALRRLVDDPVQLLALLNDTMLESMPPDAAPRFATLVLGAATPRPDGGVRLELAGGGHLPPMVVRRGGAVEHVEIGGMLLGAVPDARFAARRIDLAPGESCVLYTDGVTEAHGGVDGREAFGEQRLAEVLRGCDVLPAPGLAERVALHATTWLSGAYHDDIAVLVVQAPPPVRRSTGRHLHSVPPGTPPAGVPDPVSPPPTTPPPAAPSSAGPTRCRQESP